MGSFDNGANLNLTQLKNNLQSIGATVEGDNFPITATLNKLSYTINADGSIGEREWTIAWVYKNSNWSNPYFKDQSLKNNFDFSYEYEDYSEDIDTTYDLSSENDITGQFVVKLYSDGELEITGSGVLPYKEEYGAQIPLTPWFGYYHYIGEGTYGSEQGYGGGANWPLVSYLENNISSITIAEGITGIPADAFQGTKATKVSLPSTLTSVDNTAFRDSRWIANLSNRKSRRCLYIPSVRRILM